VKEFKKGDFWGAVELLKRVTKEDPRNAKAWSYLSLALSKVPNRLKESEEALLRAVALEPFKSENFTNLGLIYLKAGLKMRAKKQFEKALKLDPGDVEAKKGLEQTG
jgi:Flp pilus assembly protein TadD